MTQQWSFSRARGHESLKGLCLSLWEGGGEGEGGEGEEGGEEEEGTTKIKNQKTKTKTKKNIYGTTVGS